MTIKQVWTFCAERIQPYKSITNDQLDDILFALVDELHRDSNPDTLDERQDEIIRTKMLEILKQK